MKSANNNAMSDQEQRRLALNPHASFIVQAPAGSGKTELIIQRLLTLLGHVNKPEEILAITFTKKAAHEMRTRVLKALTQATSEPEPQKPHEQLTWRLATRVLQRDRELKWNLIINPNQLQIKTIDSFCTFLTSQLPLLSHFGSQPDISLYPQSLYRDTIYEVLSHVEENHEWSPAVARLLTHLDNDMNRLARLLMKLLEKRDQWQRYLTLDLSDKDMRRLLSQQIADVVNFNLDGVYALFPPHHVSELLALLTYTKKMDFTALPANDYEAWLAIAALLLTGTNEWRKKGTEDIGFTKLADLKGEELKVERAMRDRHKALLEALIDNEQLRATLANIKHLPAPFYTDRQWDTLKALLEVLKITLAQLRVTFQLHGQIDFIENAWGASQALGDTNNPTNLALALDYQIQHILVDEFQDTSFSQYRLLEMLTHGWQAGDGRSLFVVGDPMQSIYRFRQAEVGLFIRMQQEGIGEIPLTSLQLQVNFRSLSSIVEWNNRHYAAIFPSYNDIGSGAVTFSPSIANQILDVAQADSVTMQGFLQGSDQDQATALVDYVKVKLELHPGEKIAILVRSRSHLAAIIPALKEAELPYQAIDIDALGTRQSIQDLLALTRALLHPADRIAWLAILRAPWCGLTLADLLKVSGDDRYQVIWERLTQVEVISQLSADGQLRLNKIIPTLQYALQNRQRDGFRQWVEQTWLALGGPATLADAGEMADANVYLDLLEELASGSHAVNLELLNDRIKNLFAATHDDHAPIQIMTIHSAKGLEFDTVILPQLERASSRDDKSLLLWMEHPLHDENISLLLAPLHAADSESEPLYKYIEKLQKEKAYFEVDRLLYVATTRAKKRLHLIFNVKDIKKAAPRGSFLEKLWPMVQHETELTEIQQADDADTANTEIVQRPIARLRSEWRHPLNIATTDSKQSTQNVSGFMLRDHTARHIGTITHTIFQQISLQGLDWWLQQSNEQHAVYINRELMRAGLALADHTSARAQIINMITATLKDERGRWILNSHTEAQSEYKLTAIIDGKIELMVIDRTFVDETGTRWIIDYKTASDMTDTDINAFLTKQKEKHKSQMQKYATAMQQIETRTIKTALYFPALQSWLPMQT